jgi:hypothetical protein
MLTTGRFHAVVQVLQFPFEPLDVGGQRRQYLILRPFHREFSVVSFSVMGK